MSKISINIDAEYMENVSVEKKIFFLRALAKIANVDGHFDDCEKAFIMELAEDLHINVAQRQQILENLDDKTLFEEAAKINDRVMALELIKELCLLAHADDELSDEETFFIGQIGQAMGLDLEKIEQISNWVIDYLIWREQGKLIFEKV